MAMNRGLGILAGLALCALFATEAMAQSAPGGPRGEPSEPSVSGGTGQGSDRGGRRRGVPPNVSLMPNGRPEFVASGPAGQSAAAANALAAVGVQVIRVTPLATLGRQLLILDFPNTLDVAAAQAILDAAAPATRVDFHRRYRYAQGQPRYYAPALVGLADPGACPLRRAVTVGVIDGPVDPAHAALQGIGLSRESVLRKGDKTPNATHGTTVAALIAGRDPSGRIVGFAAGARIHAISAFDLQKGREGADVEAVGLALDRLAARGIRLVNMSFAGDANAAFSDVLSASGRRGLVMLAAAGNDGKALALWPAAAPEVIAVTAVDSAGRRYRKANTGRHIEFAAPGVEVYTAKGRKGGYVTGTSFAAPIATAVAARAMAAGAGSADAVRARLRASARDLGPAGRDTDFGWGLVHDAGC
ncbi:MAG: S8 family serine peptidase [Paracoccaceae bacterium]